MSTADKNAAGQVKISGGSAPYLSESKQNVTGTRDPFQEMLLNMLGGQFAKGANVPGFTMGALEAFTKNPSAAAEYFPQLAKPLLSALRPTEDREVSQLTDMFRKAGIDAGAQQSGAFAQAGRQLIGDQANRRQETLAKSYIPLTGQLSDNMSNNIRAGLSLPSAISAGWNVPAQLASSLHPLSTQTENISGGSSDKQGVTPTQGYTSMAQMPWMTQPYQAPAMTPWVDPLAERKLPGYNPY